MLKPLAVAFFLFALLMTSCQEAKKFGDPIFSPQAALKDVQSFLVYRQQYLRLADDFTAIDEQNGQSINKAVFFQRLSTGNFVPLRLSSRDSTAYYSLHSLATVQDQDLRDVVKDWGKHLYTLYQMEGKELPVYAFTDLAGNKYSKEDTKGKILAVKCWFISCVPCVKEMPALNKLVAQYKDRKDMLFVSLALDKADALKSFLKTVPFSYAVVPEQESYIMNQLGVNQFPTHILVNKKGRIVKVVNEYEEFASALRKETHQHTGHD
jgi:thiol-disulfide isomerase/thioredoxin